MVTDPKKLKGLLNKVLTEGGLNLLSKPDIFRAYARDLNEASILDIDADLKFFDKGFLSVFFDVRNSSSSDEIQTAGKMAKQYLIDTYYMNEANAEELSELFTEVMLYYKHLDPVIPASGKSGAASGPVPPKTVSAVPDPRAANTPPGNTPPAKRKKWWILLLLLALLAGAGYYGINYTEEGQRIFHKIFPKPEPETEEARQAEKEKETSEAPRKETETETAEAPRREIETENAETSRRETETEAMYSVSAQNSRSGSGMYHEGDYVYVYANRVHSGQLFDKWIVTAGSITLDSPEEESISFIMPAEDVVLEATYKKRYYYVSVGKGTGSGNYQEGTQVFIGADPEEKGEEFDKWNVVYGDVTLDSAASENTFFTMPASNVTVNAAYTKRKYSVAVENGTGDNTYSPGDTVYISADSAPSGQIFDKWEVTSGNASLKSSQTVRTSFTMPEEDVSLKAVYRKRLYSVTVTNGTGSGSFCEGQTVSIRADGAKEGETFDKWTVVTGSITLASSNSQSTTFTMPASNVRVEAVYAKNSFSVTVENGTGDGSCSPGDTVYIHADPAEAGYVFSGWEVSEGSLGNLGSSENTSFTMPGEDVTVAALYEPYEADTDLHRYRFVIDDCTWKEAFRKAKEAGGYLVNINSWKEYDYLISEIERLDCEETMFKTGGRRDLSSKDYYWIDRQDRQYGEKLNSSSSWTSSLWYNTEPSYTDTVDGKKIDESYLEFYLIDEKWQWFDVPDDIVKVVPYYSGRLGYIIEFNS